MYCMMISSMCVSMPGKPTATAEDIRLMMYVTMTFATWQSTAFAEYLVRLAIQHNGHKYQRCSQFELQHVCTLGAP